MKLQRSQEICNRQNVTADLVPLVPLVPLVHVNHTDISVNPGFVSATHTCVCPVSTASNVSESVGSESVGSESVGSESVGSESVTQ